MTDIGMRKVVIAIEVQGAHLTTHPHLGGAICKVITNKFMIVESAESDDFLG